MIKPRSANRSHAPPFWKKNGRLRAWFSIFAQTVAAWTGHPFSFLLAVVVIVAWIVTGPIFNYSDSWQLIINTGTTIITFLMVFLIQNTQNRDMMAIQTKLSELVLAMKGAENKFAAIENLSDDELEKLHDESRRHAAITLKNLQSRRRKGGTASQHDTAGERSTSAHHVNPSKKHD